jgi:hypothetical protein
MLMKRKDSVYSSLRSSDCAKGEDLAAGGITMLKRIKNWSK